MRPLRITNIQRGCVYDGPGVRTTVFLKGCLLRCPWCCNPETQTPEKSWFIDNDKCLKYKGISSGICCNCERNNGHVSIEKCPFGVTEETSVDYDFETLVPLLLKDKDLFDKTKGGVTISGGEPLLQVESLTPLLVKLQEQGVHISIASSMVAGYNDIKELLPYVNHWIIDLKLQPSLFLNDDSYFQRIVKAINLLSKEVITYRMVFINEMFEERFLILKRLEEIGVSEMEVLLCHNLGQKKYKKLSMINIDYSANKTKAEQFVLFLNNNLVLAKLLTA